MPLTRYGCRTASEGGIVSRTNWQVEGGANSMFAEGWRMWLRLPEHQSLISKWKRGRVDDAELSTAACVLFELSMNARRTG